MNINAVNNNTFNGLVIGTDRIKGETKNYQLAKVDDSEIKEILERNNLLNKLENKNTDVFIINASDNSKKEIFLLNNTIVGNSYIPADKNNKLYKTTINCKEKNAQAIMKQINKFIKRIKEYANNDEYRTDKPLEKFSNTRTGKKLLDIYMNDNIENPEEAIACTVEDVFSPSVIKKYEKSYNYNIETPTFLYIKRF